jgi:hypothetical protein
MREPTVCPHHKTHLRATDRNSERQISCSPPSISLAAFLKLVEQERFGRFHPNLARHKINPSYRYQQEATNVFFSLDGVQLKCQYGVLKGGFPAARGVANAAKGKCELKSGVVSLHTAPAE